MKLLPCAGAALERDIDQAFVPTSRFYSDVKGAKGQKGQSQDLLYKYFAEPRFRDGQALVRRLTVSAYFAVFQLSGAVHSSL